MMKFGESSEIALDVEITQGENPVLTSYTLPSTVAPDEFKASICHVPTTHAEAGSTAQVSFTGDVSSLTQGELEIFLNMSRVK
jgi:hypothetical protein